MNSIHVIAGLRVQDGGPSYSVPRLAATLSAYNCNTEIYTVARNETTTPDGIVRAFPQVFANIPLLSGLRLSPALSQALATGADKVDIIHNHGLWLMPNVVSGRIAAKAQIPLIVSPRGMLMPEALEFSSRKKRLFWDLLQKQSLSRAAAWHATSADEADAIRAFGVSAPIAIIPNGVDIAPLVALHNSAQLNRTVLFLSRIHPKKGLKNLIAAWSRVAEHRPHWQLVIAGPDENGHRAELEAQISKESVPSVKFLGAVYGIEKTKLLASADLFVLPTKTENFGIAVAEALSAGVPAIVTKGAPWSGLETERCGWWIDHGVNTLTDALLNATSLSPDVRRDMGARGRDWMVEDFGWNAIGKHMFEVYNWCLGRGERPNSVLIK